MGFTYLISFCAHSEPMRKCPCHAHFTEKGTEAQKSIEPQIIQSLPLGPPDVKAGAFLLSLALSLSKHRLANIR